MFFLLPIFSFGQNFSNINITDSINCYGDFECVDFTFINLDNTTTYEFWVWRDIGDGEFNQLASIIENFGDTIALNPLGPNSGTYNYCFELNGEYSIQLINQSGEILETFWTTDTWPANTNVVQLNSNNDLLCNGGNNGSLKVAGTGGEPPLTFTWNGPNGFSELDNNVFISEIENLVAGDYLLTLTDANGCQNNNFTGTITEPSPILVNIVQNELESCNGFNDAEITAIPSGGNGGPYTFLWDTNETTQSITTGSGTHSVVVQDSENCESVNDFNINLDPVPELEYNLQITPPNCPGQNGTVTINVTGGTGTIFYAWPNGTSITNTNNLLAGAYNMSIFDENNCSLDVNFTISEANSIEANILSQSNTSCFGFSDGSIQVEIIGGNPNYDIQLFRQGIDYTISPNTNLLSLTSYTFSNLQEGSYQMLITDDNNCDNTLNPVTFIIDEPEDLSLTNSTITNIECYGENTGSISAIIDGGTGEYSYQWTNALGNNIGSDFTVNNLIEGTYNLNVNDSLFCQSDFSFTINQVDQIILINSSSNNVSCNGNNDGEIFNTTIDGGTPPYNYIWTDISGNSFNEANPSLLPPSTYSLNVIDDNNCQQFLTNTIITEPLEIDIIDVQTFDPPSCHDLADGVLEVSASGGGSIYNYTITETNSGIEYNSNVVQNLSAGDYQLLITDENNCIYDTTFTFENPDDIIFNTQTVSTSCFGLNDGAVFFEYDNINSSFTINFNGQLVTDSVMNLSGGPFTVILTDSLGCQKTINDTIFEPLEIDYTTNVTIPSCNDQNLTSNNLISNAQIEFDFFGGSGTYELLFNNDTSAAIQGLPYFINNLSPGNYNFNLIDSDGCSLSFSQSINAPNPIDLISNTTDVVTNGTNTGQIDITVFGGNEPYQYSWIGPNGFTSTSEDITNLFSGLYTLVVNDQNNCTDTYFFDLNEPSCAIVFSPNLELPSCPQDNGIFNFNVSGGVAPYTCFMLGDINNDEIIDTILPNTIINSTLSLPLSLPPNEYTLVIEGSTGCLEEYNLIIPEINPIELNPTIFNASCFGLSDGQIIINPEDISGGTPPYDISWQGLDLNPVNPFNLSSGEYVVNIIDSSSCSEVFYYQIDEPTQITIAEAIINHPNCSEGTNVPNTDGSITIIPQGGNTNGTALYQYYWADESIPSIQNPSDLAAGIYEVLVEDQTNCTSAPFFITLNSPELIQDVSYSTSEISCNDFCDGSFIVNTNNLENESFSWYSLSDSTILTSSNAIDNLCFGSYRFTIENNQGCFVQSQALGINDLTLENPNEFSINILQSISVPFGICNGIASVSSNEGVLPLTYNWSTGDTDLIIDSLCGGTLYNVEVIDANDCISFEQFIINEENCNFDIGTLTGTQPSCFNVLDGQIFSSSPFIGGFPPFNVKVYNGDFLTQEFFTDNNTLSFNSLAEGNYNIIVEDAGGCLSMSNFEIINPEPISYSYNIEGIECFINYSPEAYINISGGTPFNNPIAYNINFFGNEGYFSFNEDLNEELISGNELQPGTFPLVITDANGCNSPTTSNQIFTIEVDPIDSILVNINTTNPTCYNDSTGSASLNISGGVGPYDINWYSAGVLSPLNDTNNNFIINQLSAGDYYVVVTDARNCQSINYFTINNPSEITISSIISPPSCQGNFDASISTNISGGSGEYNYLWSPGGFNSNVISNLTIGSYTIVVSDDLGCEKTEVFEINNPDQILIDLTITNVLCNDQNNGSILATINTPVSEATFQWYIDGAPISIIDGGNSTSLINLSSATYTVEVSNDEGCLFSETAIITEPAQLELELITTNPTCYDFNDGTINTIVSGGIGNYTYQISDNQSNPISNSSLTENLSNGLYIFSVQDENECELIENIELTEPNEMIIQIISTNPSCNLGENGNATYNVINNIGEVDQTWSIINGFEDYESISFEDTLNNLSANNYIVVITDSIGCSKSEIFTITEPDQIEVNIISNYSACSNINGASAQVNSNGAAPVNYLWTINQGDVLTQNGNQATGLNPGIIYLSGFDDNGCVIPLTEVEISPSPNPLIQVQINQTIENNCFNDSIAMLETNLLYDDGSLVNGIITYQWFANGLEIPASQSGSINSLSNLGAGEYTIEVTDQTYGCTNSASITLDNPQEISLEVVSIQNINCFGESNGEATAIVGNGTQPYSLQWTNNNQLTNIADDVFSPNNLVAGNYDLTVTDIEGCQQLTTFEITQNDSISLDINFLEPSCNDNSDGLLIISNALGGSSLLNYEWRNENNEIISTSYIAENLNSQMYYITAADDLQCELSDSIFLNEPLPIFIQDSIINVSCYGGNSGSITLDVSGGNGDFSFDWNNNVSTTNQIIGLSSGLYSVSVVDSNGCQLNSSFIVNEEDEINVVAQGVFEGCTEGFVNISNISGGVSPYEVSWIDFPEIDATIINGLSPGYYSYLVSDLNNCEISDSVLINGNNEIFTSITASDVLCTGNFDGTISIEILNDTIYPYYYSINNAESFNDTIYSNEFLIDSLPVGTYSIFIKDGEGCIDTTSIVSITQPQPLLLSTQTTNALCNDASDGMIFLSVNGGIPDYEFSLNNGNSINVTNDGLDSVMVQAGVYQLTVTDQNNCSVSDTLTIDEPNPLSLTISSISDFNGYNLSCHNSNDGIINVEANGGTGPYQLTYNDTIISFTDILTIENLISGFYSLILTDNNGCSFTIDTTLFAPDLINFEYTSISDFNGYNVSCFDSNNGFINTTVSGGVGPFDYSSNGGLTFESSNSNNEYLFSDLSSSDYNFMVRDENGCSDQINYVFTAPSEIIPSMEVIGTINCYGNNDASIVALANGGVADFTYTLTFSSDTMNINSVENSILIENLYAGIYELNITDDNGCQNSISLASQVVIEQPEQLSYDINITSTSCNASNDGSLEIINFSGGLSAYQFKVYDNFNFYYEEFGLGNFDVITLDSLLSNQYTLVMIDNNNCFNIDTILIEQPELLTVNTNVTNIKCNGANDGILNIYTSGGTFPYSISLNGELFTTNDSITINDLSDIDYTIEVTDELGCLNFSQITLTEPDSLQMEGSIENNLCYGQSFGSATFNVTGGVQPFNFLYVDNEGMFLSDNNTLSQLLAGEYVFSVIDSNDCEIVQEFTITQPEEVIINNIVTNESCPNFSDGSILTTVNNFKTSYELFWQNASLSGNENYNLSPGDYLVTVIDGNNCFSVDTATILDANNLTIEPTIYTPECSYTKDGQLIIQLNSTGNVMASLSNQLYSSQVTGINEIEFNGLAQGDYNLTILYNSNCSLDTIITINSLEGYDCIVPEPTFSPNYDGVNDEFSPMLKFNDEVELLIFNRWGEKIYQNNTMYPSWDGTDFNGNSVPSTDYYYIIKFNNSIYKDLTGIITLLR